MVAVYARLLTKVPYLLCTYYSILLAPAGALKTTMSITGSNAIGGNVTITCGWTLADKEVFFNVVLRPFPAKSGYHNYYYYMFYNRSRVAIPGNLTNKRMSTGTFDSNSNRAIVIITNVQCNDEQNLSCYYEIGFMGRQNMYPEEISLLEVKSAPVAPDMTIEQKSLHPNKGYLFVYEKTTITVKCAANLGRRGYGTLKWRLYHGGHPLLITNNDPRIQPLEIVIPRPEIKNCYDFVKQSFALTPSTALMDLVVGCFVKNRHTANRTIVSCNDTVGDMCALSPHIWTVPRPKVTSLYMGIAMALVELTVGIVLVMIAMRLLERCRPATARGSAKKPPPEASPEESEDSTETAESESESFDEEVESGV